MRNKAFENPWSAFGRRAKLSIEVLELYLLPSKILREPPELGSLIFFTRFILERVPFNPFADGFRILLQSTTHFCDASGSSRASGRELSSLAGCEYFSHLIPSFLGLQITFFDLVGDFPVLIDGNSDIGA
jgi:hypothetical protein